jgi:hypothetical protein
MVPAATPRPIIELNKWFNEVLATKETRAFLNSFGGDPFITTPDEGQALFRQGRQGLGGLRQDRPHRAAITVAEFDPHQRGTRAVSVVGGHG